MELASDEELKDKKLSTTDETYTKKRLSVTILEDEEPDERRTSEPKDLEVEDEQLAANYKDISNDSATVEDLSTGTNTDPETALDEGDHEKQNVIQLDVSQNETEEELQVNEETAPTDTEAPEVEQPVKSSEHEESSTADESNVITSATEEEPVAALKAGEIQAITNTTEDEPEEAPKVEEIPVIPITRDEQPEEQSILQESDETEQELQEPEKSMYDRAELLDSYKAIISERQHVRRRNSQLQKKLCEYFRKKKTELPVRDGDRPQTDLDRKYFRQLQEWDLSLRAAAEENERTTEELSELKERCDSGLGKLNEEESALFRKIRDTAKGLSYSQTGKRLNEQDVTDLLERQTVKQNEVRDMRVKYIMLRDRLIERERSLKSLEELGEGLHLIDYEQLRMENQSLGDKIEEREEDLSHLKKKTASAIQILAHVREKLYHTNTEIELSKVRMEETDKHLVEGRIQLSAAKVLREKARMESEHLKREAGLLTERTLLRDFEETTGEVETLGEKLKELQEQCILSQRALKMANSQRRSTRKESKHDK